MFAEHEHIRKDFFVSAGLRKPGGNSWLSTVSVKLLVLLLFSALNLCEIHILQSEMLSDDNDGEIINNLYRRS